MDYDLLPSAFEEKYRDIEFQHATQPPPGLSGERLDRWQAFKLLFNMMRKSRTLRDGWIQTHFETKKAILHDLIRAVQDLKS